MTIYTGNNYRKIYESHYGPIPKDKDGRTYDIHHLDKNRDNNLPDNLKALSIKDHYDIHYLQGDWGACYRIAGRMRLPHEEISKLATLENLKRVANGTHPFLGGKISRETQRKRVANGTHHLLNKEKARERNLKRVEKGTHPFSTRADGTSITSDKVADGTHHFLGGEIQRENNKRRVANGTHNFLGPESNLKRVTNGTNPFCGPELQLKRVAEGSHPFQHPLHWKCNHCGKEGKGNSNYLRWHDDKCKLKPRSR